MADSTIHSSTRALLSGLFDYAGLFPPAGLDMQTAVNNYLEYLAGPQQWMLGRFVLPATRLPEFRAAAAGRKVPITLLTGSNFQEDLAAAGDLAVDTFELKASTVTQIRTVADRLPPHLTVYFEVPINGDPRSLIATIAESGGRAKVRTGGSTPEAFPGSRDLGRFMEVCAAQQVPFKATAGLHHAVRSSRPLSPPSASQTVIMHGFLNVLMAAALFRAGEERPKVIQLLEDQSRTSFRFEPDAAAWRDEELDVAQLVDTRKNTAIAFGSCSFDEPVSELKELGIL